MPRDHEDLLVFLQRFDVKRQFENIFQLLEKALTLLVSSAYDERAFSCLKRVKTYLRSTMNEERLSNLACISINRETAANLPLRKMQEPFLEAKARKMFNETIHQFVFDVLF